MMGTTTKTGKILVAVAVIAIAISALFFLRPQVAGVSEKSPADGKSKATGVSSQAANHDQRSVPPSSGTSQPLAPAENLNNGPPLVDAAQANREFLESKQCFEASVTSELAQNVTSICAKKATDPQAYSACLQANGADASKIQNAQARMSSCGAQAANINETYYRSVVKAAELGNADAQICYVQAIFNHNFTDDEIKRYKHFAGIYSNDAFKRGDWRIAQLMSVDAASVAHGAGLLQYLTSGNPVTVYRMNRLMRLGAVGDYASFLDNTSNVKKLTPEQVADTEAWAQQEFSNYFSNSPKLDKAPVPCLSVN